MLLLLLLLLLLVLLLVLQLVLLLLLVMWVALSSLRCSKFCGYLLLLFLLPLLLSLHRMPFLTQSTRTDSYITQE